MRILDIQLSAFRRTRYYKQWGFIDWFEEHHNYVYATLYLFGKIPLRRWMLFKEEIPDYVITMQIIWGSYAWKSSRPYLLNAGGKKRIIKTLV